jgi:hypothetical protein
VTSDSTLAVSLPAEFIVRVGRQMKKVMVE